MFHKIYNALVFFSSSRHFPTACHFYGSRCEKPKTKEKKKFKINTKKTVFFAAIFVSIWWCLWCVLVAIFQVIALKTVTKRHERVCVCVTEWVICFCIEKCVPKMNWNVNSNVFSIKMNEYEFWYDFPLCLWVHSKKKLAVYISSTMCLSYQLFRILVSARFFYI